MTQISFAIVGFDLDGTLVDTSADLAAAVNDALALADRPALAVAQVHAMIGGGAKHMLAQGLAATGGCTPEQFRPLYKHMLAYYAAHLSVHSRPFPGAVAALDRLAALGVTTAIVTNKFEALAVRLLTDLGLHDRFACVIGGDTLGPGRAKPDRAPIDEMVRRCGGGHAAFVGDTMFDVEAARNAGVPSIAVRFGADVAAATALGADAVIDSFDDLLPALERLGA